MLAFYDSLSLSSLHLRDVH